MSTSLTAPITVPYSTMQTNRQETRCCKLLSNPNSNGFTQCTVYLTNIELSHVFIGKSSKLAIQKWLNYMNYQRYNTVKHKLRWRKWLFNKWTLHSIISISIVPHLHCNKPVVHHHLLGQEVCPYCSFVLVTKLLVHILVHEGGLSNTEGKGQHTQHR